MDVSRIEHLNKVLKTLTPDRKIVSYKLTRLTSRGENYGSLMLRLQVSVVNVKTGVEETQDLVAKLLPPNQYLRHIFQVQVTYKNEANFYGVVIPALENFQRKQGATVTDLFPKFYGTRISLDPESEMVDNDAVIILENLKNSGYTLVDRTVGFDLECTKLLVKNLADFHAVPLALKLTQPEVFKKKIHTHLTDFIEIIGLESVFRTIVDVVRENEACGPYLQTVEKLVRQKSLKIQREPLVSISHNDYWVNNIMLKFENGRPVASKMIDFQKIEYKSPCRDLLFFLFTSVQLKVLETNFDYFLDLYYEKFTKKLDELKCNSAFFTRELFEKELELAIAESEYFHSAHILFAVCADATELKELSDVSEDDHEAVGRISTTLKEKIWFLTLECARKGWLK